MSTIVSSLDWKSVYPPKRKYLGWAALSLFAFLIFLTDLHFLNPNDPYRPYHFKVRWALIPHILCGSVAMLSGPLQFSSRLRRSYPRFHRILGRFYVGSVLIGAPAGIMVAVIGPKDSYFTFGIAVHATVWFITTLMAFLTARNRQIPEHKQWMVRSYVLTFSFVASRVLAPVWHAMGVLTPHDYGIVDTALNVAYLLVADISLNWRQLTTARPAIAARPVSAAVVSNN